MVRYFLKLFAAFFSIMIISCHNPTSNPIPISQINLLQSISIAKSYHATPGVQGGSSLYINRDSIIHASSGTNWSDGPDYATKIITSDYDSLYNIIRLNDLMHCPDTIPQNPKYYGRGLVTNFSIRLSDSIHLFTIIENLDMIDSSVWPSGVKRFKSYCDTVKNKYAQ
jgi:hypothetical protein